LVLRVTYHDVAFLLTGDAEANEEQWILANTDPDLLRADVLKLGHHGSRTSSTSPFLDAVAPRLGVVSVGAGNTYGHPLRKRSRPSPRGDSRPANRRVDAAWSSPTGASSRCR
jgi:beta-lactamase superfamily II metal-dependent hydrolase